MNANPSELPYTTRIEFSAGRGRNTLVFQDKEIPLTVRYPVPDAYQSHEGGEVLRRIGFDAGVTTVLSLLFLETRTQVLREFAAQQQQMIGQQKSPIAGALVDTDPTGPGSPEDAG